MKHIYRITIMVASAAFFIAQSAVAQNSGTVSNHAVPIGKGAGVSGFSSAAPGTSGLPLASNGASADPSFQVLGTAGGGTGTSNSTNSANDVLASNGANGTFVHTALTTLINTVCTASPSSCAGIFGYYSPIWFGAKCDNSTNDTTAIQAALTAATGSSLIFPSGTCIVSTTTLTVPANTIVAGQSRDVSIIKMTSCVPVFTVSNVSNVTIEKLWMLGTDACVSWGASPIGAINFGSSVSASNWTFRNLRQSGFNGNYWNKGNAAATVSNVLFDNISIESTSSDAPGGSNNPNIALAFYSGTGGPRWENLTIQNSQFNGTDICIHVIIFGNAYKYSINNNRSLNAGGTNTNSHCTNGTPATNSYAISVYDANDDGNPQQDGVIANNYIRSPAAAGIYLVPGSALTRAATTTPMLIANNEIVAQTHTDTALPRGAIAVNTSTDLTISGNKLYGNAIGINLTAQTAGVVSVLSNDCYSGAGSSLCLNLQAGSNGSSNTDRRSIRGNYFESGGNSVNLVSATGARFNELDLAGNTIVADSASTGAGLAAANQWTSGVIQLKANTFTGPSAAAMMSVSGMTGNLSLSSNTFTVPSTGASGILFANLPAATNGSDIFVQDGTAASAPCTGAGTGSRAFRQNGAWKCF
jgi:hypothetical protein